MIMYTFHLSLHHANFGQFKAKQNLCPNSKRKTPKKYKCFLVVEPLRSGRTPLDLIGSHWKKIVYFILCWKKLFFIRGSTHRPPLSGPTTIFFFFFFVSSFNIKVAKLWVKKKRKKGQEKNVLKFPSLTSEHDAP